MSEQTVGFEITIRLQGLAFEFSSEDEWAATAQRKFGAFPYQERQRLICIDKLGRVCQIGGDFSRATKDGAYPIRVFEI